MNATGERKWWTPDREDGPLVAPGLVEIQDTRETKWGTAYEVKMVSTGILYMVWPEELSEPSDELR